MEMWRFSFVFANLPEPVTEKTKNERKKKREKTKTHFRGFPIVYVLPSQETKKNYLLLFFYFFFC